ncbi:hypothetical protein L218DRAFT_1067941 [Marasmius fiardii PR-910]|nr:hypothetical protein L218DRAFT_1067941 [Marasmius fiardii PR-910]
MVALVFTTYALTFRVELEYIWKGKRWQLSMITVCLLSIRTGSKRIVPLGYRT